MQLPTLTHLTSYWDHLGTVWQITLILWSYLLYLTFATKSYRIRTASAYLIGCFTFPVLTVFWGAMDSRGLALDSIAGDGMSLIYENGAYANIQLAQQNETFYSSPVPPASAVGESKVYTPTPLVEQVGQVVFTCGKNVTSIGALTPTESALTFIWPEVDCAQDPFIGVQLTS
ncbi:hypothetical protein L202_02619 [Cryptococcus amylolentus CBS 6039]|uniref:Uncharacterized protein n=1 Tax=Cryptococcus amylolentus CBS 6039 TaxID=1295533 RepID=A0A1E3HVL7_9TREE|nr:hypothetical protein L202_02619 [Cryptococcus amylolentus CBS 6039]ODN80358.1 hypothetical protein L202_02619 [Cryptococcus amylolentus CBS 6039]